MSGIGDDWVDEAKKSLLAFAALAMDASDRYSLNRTPEPGSLAEQEIKSYGAPGLLESAYSLAVTALRVSADHALSLCRSLEGTALLYAPFTDARGVLESSSRCFWLIDPNIDFNERTARSINLLIAETRGNIRFLKSFLPGGAFGLSEADINSKIAQCDMRIGRLKSDAGAWGLSELEITFHESPP